jgi:hypothetical protein
MARVNNLEPLALKVRPSFLNVVIAKPGRMKQSDPVYRERAKSGRRRDAWREYWDAVRPFLKTSGQFPFSGCTETIAACREGKNDAV